jgi:hypothetical protein
MPDIPPSIGTMMAKRKGIKNGVYLRRRREERKTQR